MVKKNSLYLQRNTLVFMVIVLIVFNVFLFLGKSRYLPIALGISLLVIIALVLQNYLLKKRIDTYIDGINAEIEKAGTTMLTQMPVPLIITDADAHIIWFNSKMKRILPSQDYIMGKTILDLFPLWDWSEIKNHERQFYQQRIGDATYQVIYSRQQDEPDGLYSFYFLSITDYVNLQKKYEDEQNIFAHLQIDNMEEVISSAEADSAPFIRSEMNRMISLWVRRHGGILYQLDESNFVAVIQKSYLENIKTKKFTILDEVRTVKKGNRYPITLSIGINEIADNMIELDQGSKQALELALGRGGDQAVVKKGNSYEFFGGRSKSVQRKSRVKSRVIAQAITTLIKESRKVYVMGHRYPDLDAIGAAIGMYRAAKSLKKQAYIILNDLEEEQVKELLDQFTGDENYTFVHSSVIDGKVDKEDLLIIVDTHRASLVEAPELIQQFDKRVVVDHHRRSADAIEKASLFYLEPFASSASELVTEILQYLPDNVRLKPKEANALLAGIVLDTKNFIFNTGVRTFDAASYLRKEGANTQEIRDFFQDDLEESILRGDIISEARIYREGIAVSTCKEPDANIKKIISQGADALINIRNIKTSFVIGKDLKDTIFVSARSDGDRNVQVILESVGGGGHLEVAGAQFTDKTIEEVEAIIEKAIDHYVEDES